MASQVTTITASTAETTIITAGTSGVNNVLTGLVITTTDAAAATLTIRDSTGGTIRMVIDYPNAAVAPGQPFVLFFAKDWPLYQSAPANNWTAQASVNAGLYHITAFYIEA
jgi:hypothetical protein